MAELEGAGGVGAEVRRVPFLLAVLPLAAQVRPELAKLFEYDAAAPLAAEETPVEARDGWRMRAVKFAGPRGGQATGLLVIPDGKGPFAGIIWTHSQGPSNFLPDALLLARAGALSLLLDLPASSEQMSPEMEKAVVNIRRAADLLAARGDVDPKRLAYAGHSYGAMMGAVVAGVDKRFKCFVFEVGLLGMSIHLSTSPHPWAKGVRESMTKEKFEALMERIRPYDAGPYIAHAAPAALLFQSARFDEGVPEKDAQDFFDRASQPKEMKWYDTGHEANDISVVVDRARFLGKTLALLSLETVIRKKLGLSAR